MVLPGISFAQSATAATAGITASKNTHSPAIVALASAVVPGAGQLLIGQRRSAAYLALEAAGLAYYVSKNRDGNRQRRQYRSLSRDVARAQLSPSGPDGTWDYYEHMEKYVASGAFDRV